MWIYREITSELRELAKTFPVVALVGPRQVGKTSLLERVFPEYAYVSLDVAVQAEAAETRPTDFLSRFPPPVVLDEIQYAPSFFRFIKTEVDKRKGDKGLFIITGSQNFMLLENLSESLAGRAAVVPFLSLSGREWSHAREISQHFGWQDFLFRGFFL
ncbi:MAG: AAA family ATPase, partial [Desulfovermiculus sp.]|nr:AAA family ATPase [Desulfovermiculus sp.]